MTTLAQTQRVLTKVSNIDGRTFDDKTVSTWYRIIKDTDYVKAMQAVTLIAREVTDPITPAMIVSQVDALWAENAQYTPAHENAERTGADKPENFDAMAAAWDDPVEFAKQRRIYQDQLDRDGYIGPEVS